MQAPSSVLFGHAETEEQFKEAVAFWTPILESLGASVGRTEFEPRVYFKIPYSLPDGRVIRRFLAEPRQFKPKDEASLRQNMAEIAGKMTDAGLTPVASFVTDLDFMLPTYAHYYLTRPDATGSEPQDHEKQVRILDRGEDLDMDILAKARVAVLQKPEPWILVYVGPELGMVSRCAETKELVEKKLQDKVAYLTGLGKEMIGSRVFAMDPVPEAYCKYQYNLYFYQ